MTEKQFRTLCETTEIGTVVSFQYEDHVIRGKFVGCAEDALVIEANGKSYIWPWQLCDYKKSTYPRPTYS